MVITYTQAEEALANIRGDIINARKTFTDGRTRIVQADNVLANLAVTYAEVLAAIEAAPDDPAYDVLKARASKIVSEGVVLKSETAADRAALGI